MSALVALAFAWAAGSVACGEVRQHCDGCGRGFVVAAVEEPGGGDGPAICRTCYRDADHSWRSIDRHRYATFADGTLIDLKYFRASMLVSQVAGLTLGRACRGVACANLAGWAVEW